MVYVVQEVPGRDFSPALQFGELKLLLPPGNIVLSTGPTIRRLRQGLAQFSDKDYLLLTGDTVAIGLATALAADANAGRVQLLKWNAREARYFPLSADFRMRPMSESI